MNQLRMTVSGSVNLLVEPYSEFSARQSVLRLFELLSPGGTEANTLYQIGLNPGSTVFESIRDGTASAPCFREVEVSLPGKKNKGKKEVVKLKQEGKHAFADWNGEWPQRDLAILPMVGQTLEILPCLKSIQLAAFNPPPPHLKQIGHQLYLQITLLEGDTLILVCTSRGWYASRSSTSIFDPAPRSRSGEPSQPLHSLVDLLHSLSPFFSDRLSRLQPLSPNPPPLEPISTVPIPQAEPAYPFLTTIRSELQPDPIKTQLAYLHTGAITADGLDGARDWNEELQGIRELPKKTMPERVMREKIAQKTYAEFTAASVRGVLAVAKGDIPALNPTEDPRAHMWLTSNIFITKALDLIDAYAHLGGDAAAHISHGKDAEGVKALNKLDIDGVSVLGHTVVDWAGERWVCQTMLPGIFSRRPEAVEEVQAVSPESDGEVVTEKKDDWVEVNGSPSKSEAMALSESNETSGVAMSKEEETAENPLIIYGFDSEITASIHWDAVAHNTMSKVASALRLAPHTVKDGSGKDYEFYASAEVKALYGNDGRRYLLDLPRLSAVDVEWLDCDMDGKLLGTESKGTQYPHRLVLLRSELVEMFWESELKRWANRVASRKAQESSEARGSGSGSGESVKAADAAVRDGDDETKAAEATVSEEAQESPAAAEAAAERAGIEAPLDASIDASFLKDFKLVLNPDAFVDQPLPKGSSVNEGGQAFVPSSTTDESDPAIKAVRDASLFLRQVIVPAIVLDALTGNLSGVMDGWSLTRAMHTRGINMRYLGHIASTIESFANSSKFEQPGLGPLASFKVCLDSFSSPCSSADVPFLGARDSRDGFPGRQARHTITDCTPDPGARSMRRIPHPQLSSGHEPQPRSSTRV